MVMAKWDEQLAVIRQLRDKRDRCDRELYESQIARQKAKARQSVAKRRETVPPGNRDRIALLQSELTELERRSHALGREPGAARARELAAREHLKALRQHVSALDSEIAATKALPRIKPARTAADR